MPNVAIEQVEVDRSSDFAEHGHGQMRGKTDRGRLTIQGWALGKRSRPRAVELRDQQGMKITDAPIDQPRVDIAEAFPDFPGASTSGFKVSVHPVGSGGGRIHVLVAFEDGTMSEIASLSCRVRSDEAGNGAPRWSVVTESDKVLLGKQGWLYLRWDNNDVLGQHTGLVKMDAGQQEKWRGVLEGRVVASRRLRIPWHCIVVPDKEAVYPEYLPDEIEPVARRPVHDFLEVAESVGAPVSYALDRLLAAKQDDELYSRTDTHWNFWGAYLAYRMFCEKLTARGIDVNVLEDSDLVWFEETVEGDLGRKVRPEPRAGSTILARVKQPRSRVVFDNEVHNHGRVICFERDRPGPSCVLFGESFSDYLMPFLQESFQRFVFVHTSMFISDVLEREQPDAVLSLPVERFLIRVPNDAGAFAKLQALALRKGGELPWRSETD